jgi:ribosomal protein L19E
MKTVLRGKYIALSAFIKKLESPHTRNLKLHLNALEKKEGGREGGGGGEGENQRINKTKSSFFEKIKKMNKPLAKLTRRLRESTQINKIRNKKVDITTHTEETQRIISSSKSCSPQNWKI